jgi:phosphatidylserine/phosphatidylglycerophosphate/cardiolipin synthase-like enzyme
MIWGMNDSLVIANQLKAAGITVLNKQHLQLIHNKMMVVDDNTLVNGSANWSKSWWTRNDESYTVMHNMDASQKNYLDAYWKQLAAL